MSRGFAVLSADFRAQRSYRLSWIVSFCVVAQMGLSAWVVARWGNQMPILEACSADMASGVHVLSAYLSTGWMIALTTLVSMVAMAINFWVMALALFRINRLAKGLSGGTARSSWIYLRNLIASPLPTLIWIVGINSAPPSLMDNPAALSLLLIAFSTSISSLRAMPAKNKSAFFNRIERKPDFCNPNQVLLLWRFRGELRVPRNEGEAQHKLLNLCRQANASPYLANVRFIALTTSPNPVASFGLAVMRS
jgi:hypothetical protein